MTEITEPTLHLCWNDYAIRGAVQALRAANLTAMADDVEAQLKPAIEEPTEFGSLVRAICGLSVTGNLWQMSPGDGSHYWTDAHGCAVVWSELKDPEVLRVGIGEPANQVSDRASVSTPSRREQVKAAIEEAEALARAMPGPDDDAYGRGQYAGFSQALGSAAGKVGTLRSEAITAERKNAYDVVLNILAEMQP